MPASSALLARLVVCPGCDHDLMIHDDGRCLERGCPCHMSRLQALGREVDACSWHRRHTARDPVIIARPEATPGASSSRLPCQILGDRLSSERTSLGWSQSEFASIAGVERTSVQRIERGKKSNPGFSKVARLLLTLHRRHADDGDGHVPPSFRRDNETERSSPFSARDHGPLLSERLVLGPHILAARLSTNVSCSQLATASGLHEDTIQRIETGAGDPGFFTIALVFLALRVPLAAALPDFAVYDEWIRDCNLNVSKMP